MPAATLSCRRRAATLRLLSRDRRPMRQNDRVERPAIARASWGPTAAAGGPQRWPPNHEKHGSLTISVTPVRLRLPHLWGGPSGGLHEARQRRGGAGGGGSARGRGRGFPSVFPPL